MSTFSIIKAELVAEVLNTHPATATHMATVMVRQLLTVQSEAVTFMETYNSFSTVASQAAYDSATTGFPKSLLRFDRLYYDLGSSIIPIYTVERDGLRQLQELSPVSYPTSAAWIGERLEFGPAPLAAYTVKWDGILDATKDTATGDLITTASTTETNAWFTKGAVGLKALCLGDYYSTSPDQRPEMAAAQQRAAALAINSYRSTQAQRLQLGGYWQIPSAFTRYPRGGTRREILHPGGPI